MKKIRYIIICLLFAFTGCLDVLEEEVVSGITADVYFVDEKGLNDALTAGYARLKDFYGDFSGYALLNTGTDIYGKSRSARTISLHTYDGTLNSSEQHLAPAWNTFYKAINVYNTIIGRAPEVIDDEEALNRIVGEARFLRAYVYFQLVQQWGAVHLTLEETVGVEIEAKRTPEEEIYNQAIIPDLEFAIDNLPPEPTEPGRACQAAAKAIRARVALVQKDWSLAEVLAKSVITDYSYSLTDTYAELWDMANEVNSETIWSIQFTSDPLVSQANGGNNYFTPWYTKHPGLKRSPDNGGTWVGFKPTPYFYELWDIEKDRRYQEGLKTVWECNRLNNAPAGMQLGDTALFYNINEMTDEEIASKIYVVYDRSKLIADDSAWPQPMKVRDESLPDFGTKASRDVVVVRFAEMYLIAAEAMYEQGKPDAINYINTLRRKRAYAGFEDAMEITAAELNTDFILDERARELFAEGHRWYTLKRKGLLVERVRQYNPYGAMDNIQEYHNYRPIPLEQIDRTWNKEDFPQNPGYSN